MRCALVAIVLAAIPGCYESHVVLGDAPFTSAGVTRPCPMPTSGLSRDCGWRVDSMRTCVPGAALTVGCGTGCGLGSCTGDAMIRLCRGSADCTGASSFGQNDDSCGSLCPLVTTTCPPEGAYTVLTTSFNSASTASCSIAVR